MDDAGSCENAPSSGNPPPMGKLHFSKVPNPQLEREREFFIDNLLVRIHFFIEMIWWTGLVPWEVDFPFTVSLISTFPGNS